MGAILLFYHPVLEANFVNWNDDAFVTQNPLVRSLSLENILAIFKTPVVRIYSPLTILSFAMEYHFFGLDPFIYHLDNLLLHMAVTCMIFIFFLGLGFSLRISCLAALIFGIHPMHVESVAWITERKDVLCAFFWILTIWSYLYYLKRPGLFRYAQLIILLCLSLMTKPMPVTLPFTLLLLDFWPLRRFDVTLIRHELKVNKDITIVFSNPLVFSLSFIKNFYSFIRRNSHLFWEKLPLFIPVLLSSIITIKVSIIGNAVPTLEIFPLHVRIENALFSYIHYIGKMIWPFNLAVFYPHGGDQPFSNVIISSLIIIAVSAISIKTAQKRPWFFFGWFWYLGTLVPVIGLVQIGGYAMADRFAYIPFWGIYIIIAWGIPLLFSNVKSKNKVLAIMSICYFSILFFITCKQITYWKDSITLFEHALKVTRPNAIAHNNLGNALQESGNWNEALSHFMKALQIDPKLSLTYNNLGIALAEKGETDKAIYYYTKAIDLNPEFSEAYNNLGILLFKKNKLKEAIDHFQAALKLMPDNVDFQHNFLIILQNQEQVNAAIEKIQTRLKSKPNDPLLHYQLGNMYEKKGEDEKAILSYRNALSVKSDFKPAINSIFMIYKNRKEYPAAIFFLEKLINLEPENNGLYYDIACLYAKQNKQQEAMEWLTKAVEMGFNNWEMIKTERELIHIIKSSDYQKLLEKVTCHEDKDKL